MKRDPEARGSVLWGRTTESEGELYQSELSQYRSLTEALLQKYFQVSLDLGRLPSALGGEMFRARVTSYRVPSLEDVVIFVTDTAACIDRLGETARQFIALNVFQDYPKGEAAARAGCDPRQGLRIYQNSLDEMSEVFLRFGMIEPIDWIGGQVAEEGWFEGCPVLRRNTWSRQEALPPKKGNMRERRSEERRDNVVRMKPKVG